MNISKLFEEGAIELPEATVSADTLAWNEHASFKGVYLKHLVRGEQTDGKYSCHIVRIRARHEIGDHVHEGKWESHQVLDGDGALTLGGRRVRYVPGVMAVIPENVKHKVMAGDEDMYLLATFVPALL